MSNLIFSLNATIPVFLLMILGIFFKKVDIVDDVLASKMNKFVFLIPLPVLLFHDLATVDFSKVWDLKFVLFCFFVTLLSITIAFLLSLLFKRNQRGEFIQATYRSSAALLGIALIQNIYGDATMAPLMIIGSVPLYNIMATVVLVVFNPNNTKFDINTFKSTLISVIKNPIIIGILIGLIWSLFKLPMPYILDKTVSNIGSIATPMGLIAMGASFDFNKALGNLKPALLATFFKLFGFAMIFLPVAVLFGFTKQKLIAILIMLGSATTVSSYVMAKNMGHDGVLTSSAVLLTTLLSGFSITFWIYILKFLNLL